MSFGLMGVDWSERINYERLRKDRLRRAKEALKKHNLGAFLCFDYDNIRYMTSTYIGPWARAADIIRYCLLPDGGEPILFERANGAIAKALMLAPWMGERIRASKTGWRGRPGQDLLDKAMEEVKELLKEHGLADQPVGVDFLTVPLQRAFERAGLKVVDGDWPLFEARMIKTPEEIECHRIIAAMVDAVYDHIGRAIRPGVRENELVALVHQLLYSMGADHVEAVNCLSGPRTNPNHHDFSDRMIRPGDIVFLDIMASFNGYKSCYYRTFCCGRSTKEQRETYRKALEWLQASIDAARPGASTADIASRWPPPQESWGSQSEYDAPGNHVGHGIGLSLHEPPYIHRSYSFDHPAQLQEGMVIALETYAGRKGGDHGARIEDMVLITSTGCEVLSKYPKEELIECPVSGPI